MKKLAVLAVALLVSTAAHAWDGMNRQIDATNFSLDQDCSATLVAPNRLLTAAHCILLTGHYQEVKRKKIGDDGKVTEETVRISVPGQAIQYKFKGSVLTETKSYVYHIEATDAALDLGLVSIPTVDQETSPVSCDAPQRGDTVYAVGNSFGVLYSTLTKGIVSSTQRSYRDLKLGGDLGDTTDNGEHGLVQHSATIAPGNSGGALYNDKGFLIGVNVRGMPGGFSFAVPQQDVVKFLNDNGIKVCGGKAQ